MRMHIHWLNKCRGLKYEICIHHYWVSQINALQSPKHPLLSVLIVDQKRGAICSGSLMVQ